MFGDQVQRLLASVGYRGEEGSHHVEVDQEDRIAAQTGSAEKAGSSHPITESPTGISDHTMITSISA